MPEPQKKETRFVKQADTWHRVDADAKPAVLSGRPCLRALCGTPVHMGTFAAPIDAGEHCKQCAE
jgi:hypothetical protein